MEEDRQSMEEDRQGIDEDRQGIDEDRQIILFLKDINPKHDDDEEDVELEPVFCVKAKANGEKIFINMCANTKLPFPAELREIDWNTILSNAYTIKPAVPFYCCDPPHRELDRSGNACDCYDVIMDKEFFTKHDSPLFRKFIVLQVTNVLKKGFNIVTDLKTVRMMKKTHHGTISSWDKPDEDVTARRFGLA